MTIVILCMLTASALNSHLTLSGLTFRQATEADQKFLLALYATTRQDLQQLQLPPALTEHLITMQFQAKCSGYRQQFPKACSLIIEHANRGIGRILLDTTNTNIRLIDIALLPDHRRQGYGRACIRALQDFAIQRNKPVQLSVHQDNIAAHTLYLALGFSPIQSTPPSLSLCWLPTGTGGL
ncbi:GNAT family N-acetyltransferase [Alkalimonas sp.]|uniref:GNAT family N-acetyltransferase n=1 Tax=Alkalimonas sp. TaxID=1872453 RepID=UPI00263B0A20|nr:GNAT family N-acetyltransferase [Alkalimonas sp.]MCC5825398.1 GNAT family N-acetyltransferase [Alkalimonas sp.]